MGVMEAIIRVEECTSPSLFTFIYYWIAWDCIKPHLSPRGRFLHLNNTYLPIPGLCSSLGTQLPGWGKQSSFPKWYEKYVMFYRCCPPAHAPRPQLAVYIIHPCVSRLGTCSAGYISNVCHVKLSCFDGWVKRLAPAHTWYIKNPSSPSM